MQTLLSILGGALVLVAVVGAVALPGADANASFTGEGWAWIVGVGVMGCIVLWCARLLGPPRD